MCRRSAYNTTLWYNAYEPKAAKTISRDSALALPSNRRIGDGLVSLHEGSAVFNLGEINVDGLGSRYTSDDRKKYYGKAQ